jgi:bifunctional non-homologous end joining protein LigD
MPLETYRRKRNFRTTPEPKGRVGKRRAKALAFVIQKHAASRLHYDFRLELNGVLLSWAVPKGPSLDPQDKRLAMHVEDHPLEYGSFEGIIPPKQYGSGTVMLWDAGTWNPREDPEAGYRKGRLKFDLHGEKLRGGWMLVRTRGSKYGGDKSWLLIKENDEFARPAGKGLVVEEEPDSVTTGRSLEEIAAGADRVWHSGKSVAQNVREGAIAPRRTRARKKRARATAGSTARKARRSPTRTSGRASAFARGSVARYRAALSAMDEAVTGALPRFIEPELAMLVKEAPQGPEWLHEMKLDGYRILSRIEDGKVRLYTRNRNDWTAQFPSIAEVVARLPIETAWLDGEIVVMKANGLSSFQALQNALSREDTGSLHYYVFDLPFLDGRDLRKAPLLERKNLLEKVLSGAPPAIRYSSHVLGSGEEFYGQACKLELEGIVSKRSDSAYTAGRGRDWLKIKCGLRQEMVIGGYTDPAGARSGLGALLLGVYEPDGTLRYSGKVGTGFDHATLLELRDKLDRLASKEPPFSNPPRGAEARRAHWVKPRLVAEIAFTEWTDEGTLRHPSFQGLREDKNPRDVVRERPGENPSEVRGQASGDTGHALHGTGHPPRAARRKSRATRRKPRLTGHRSAVTGHRSTVTGHRSQVTGHESRSSTIAGIPLSHPDKVMYPEAGITKRDLALYYEAVADRILPHLKGRPLSLVRCPDGWHKHCFYQKHVAKGVHRAVGHVRVPEGDGKATYMMANSLPAVVALVQMGVLELHPWGSTERKLGFPDRIIFDIDPDDDLPWSKVADAARLVKSLLEEIGLPGFLKTTGGKGLHVVVPVRPTRDWDTVKAFTKSVAELLAKTVPDRFTATMSKAARRGRIYIDYLRNAEGATSITAYGARARANAPVSVPIAWSELDEDVRFDHFNVSNVPSRLARMKKDPWEEFFSASHTVTVAMMKKFQV